MSGTSASSRPTSISNAVGLPVPRMYLVAPNKARAAANPNNISFTEMLDGVRVTVESMPYLSASEIPAALFARDLRLELLRYAVKKSSAVKKQARSGYKHPTHVVVDGAGWLGFTGATPVATPLPASKHRGGARSNPLGTPASARMTTEWAVKDADASFLIDTLGDFYTPGLITFNDDGRGFSPLRVHVPSDAAARAQTSPQGIFGYAPKYRPNYFKFRFSVADLNDPRARITGPTSEVFVMAPSVHPFYENVAATQRRGVMILGVSSSFNPAKYNVWMNTRLPGGSL